MMRRYFRVEVEERERERGEVIYHFYGLYNNRIHWYIKRERVEHCVVLMNRP